MNANHGLEQVDPADPDTGASVSEEPNASHPPYPVGRGRPPMHTRFKSGQSGNSKGRPKRSHNLRTILLEELQKPVKVRGEGRRTMTKQRALVVTNINKAINGDPKATQTVLTLMRSTNLLEDEPHESPANSDAVAAEDLAIVDAFRRHLKGETG